MLPEPCSVRPLKLENQCVRTQSLKHTRDKEIVCFMELLHNQLKHQSEKIILRGD